MKRKIKYKQLPKKPKTSFSWSIKKEIEKLAFLSSFEQKKNARAEDLSQMEVEKPKPPISRIDLSSEAKSSVWLVKIPNYLADAWIHAERGTELGSVTLTHNVRNNEGLPRVEMSVVPLPGMKENIPLEFRYS